MLVSLFVYNIIFIFVFHVEIYTCIHTYYALQKKKKNRVSPIRVHKLFILRKYIEAISNTKIYFTDLLL